MRASLRRPICRYLDKYLRNPLAIVALAFSFIAIVITLGILFAVGRNHQQGRFGRAAKINFLALLLAGLFLVSVGSLLVDLEPSNGNYVASVWIISIE